MNKYSVISYHPVENGYDSKGEHYNLADAKKECKQLLFHDNENFRWYEKMFILTDKEVVMVFDEHHKQGRKPYECEKEDSDFTITEQQLSLNF